MDDPSAANAAAAMPEEVIRRRSYEIWLRENCPYGREADHWFQAKAELLAQREEMTSDGGIRLGDKSVCFWDHFG